jgi:hypothetical protein
MQFLFDNINRKTQIDEEKPTPLSPRSVEKSVGMRLDNGHESSDPTTVH